MKLIPITYHNKKYPSNIISNIDEIAGNLDKSKITPTRSYSLHTEYSHMKRKLDSCLLNKYKVLKESHKNYVPKLWASKEWAIEFANFIIDLIGDNKAPEIIEIHPPFDDYCNNFEEFFDIYEEFEKIIMNIYPSTLIFIENRCGTFYTGGNFLLSTSKSIIEFLKQLSTKNLRLKMVLDYPQVFSAEKIKLDNIKLDKIISFNQNIKPYINLIGGFHIWGKRKNSTDTRWTPHTGNLNTLFSFNNDLKVSFLKSILNTFNDDIERYFVPEVNSSEEDLQSIVIDLIDNGFKFPINNKKTITSNYKYIEGIEWISNLAYLNIYNSIKDTKELIPLIGLKTINITNNKRCTGYKDLKTTKHINCPNRELINEKDTKCPSCNNMDKFQYCVMCKGDTCRNYSPEAREYCNKPHYVYLAYFSKDKIKVGTAYYERKITRLQEQGAPVAILIAKTNTGKLARLIEHKIKEMGYAETITSKYKASNINIDNDKDKILNILEANLKRIKDNIDKSYLEYFIDIEVYDDYDKVNNIKSILNKGNIIQTSLFDTDELDFKITKLDKYDINNKEIIGVVGTNAYIKSNNNYYLNLKEIIGHEIKDIK